MTFCSYAKKYLLVSIFMLASLLTTPQAIADTCKIWSGNKVCIIQIKRSAKYYWEYRTILNINEKRQPETVYDCLNFSYLRSDKTQIYFENNPDDLGNFVCSLFK